MASFLLSLAYRVFRNPFGAWALLALSLALGITALLKALCWLLAPAVLRPDTLRSFFQLAPFAFIPLALYLGLAEYRWKTMQQGRHAVARWSTRNALLAVTLWLLALLGLLLFNVKAFPAS
ncbi:MAG: hypothetical protein EOO12_10805 [Chitinophagaceae bacterium]|nr:MAG: hypothetical protein EOO12_10805 [Chitinophagaceae bacterium]